MIHDLHLLASPKLSAEELISKVLTDGKITFKIRHTADYNTATLEDAGNGRYLIRSSKPIHGVAPGQFCVIYDEAHHRCLGSGEITL